MGFLQIGLFSPLKIECFASHYSPTFMIYMCIPYTVPFGRGVSGRENHQILYYYNSCLLCSRASDHFLTIKGHLSNKISLYLM